MKIAVIAHSLYPIAEPYAGGLEMITELLVRNLLARGHRVDLYAHPDSAPDLPLIPMLRPAELHPLLEQDWQQEDERARAELVQVVTYGRVMDQIARRDYDIVHNHSLHHIPIARGNARGKTFVTSLHTPAFLHLRAGLASLASQRQTFTAVSARQAELWGELTPAARVIPNGIDVAAWKPGYQPEDYLFWMGRLCPEKAPHHAIEACRRAGRPIRLAGPVANEEYFEAHVRPLLDDPLVTYLGHLPHRRIKPLLARAHAYLFTSTWEEPYGLVLAEALACATPVVGYRIGAAPEIVTPEVGRLVAPQDVAALAAAIPAVGGIDRRACRARAERECSARRMTDRYEQLYRSLLPNSAEHVSDRLLRA